LATTWQPPKIFTVFLDIAKSLILKCFLIFYVYFRVQFFPFLMMKIGIFPKFFPNLKISIKHRIINTLSPIKIFSNYLSKYTEGKIPPNNLWPNGQTG